MGPDKIFTTPELQRRYSKVEISLLTPKVTLVPAHFFAPEEARQTLFEVVALRESDAVDYVEVPSVGGYLIYSNSIDEALSRAISQTVLTTGGNSVPVLPEMYYLLAEAARCKDYNKIIASWQDGYLHLVVCQGKSLLLGNVFEASTFTTAQYFIFLSMKRLQLNPEVSTIYFRTPLSSEDEMSLYRYFRSVEQV